ncbi:MAG: hypothetical protein PHQ04_01470 [Opitutaceae bacterium]|nr:hypothetical protein [Opitutaceae bacterium]
MSDSLWILGVRLAGAFHFVTLLCACLTPIPPDWESNLGKLRHRRLTFEPYMTAGATMALLGLISLLFAPALITGTPFARIVCCSTAIFWGGRLGPTRWFGVRPVLTTPWLRFGYKLFLAECVVHTLAYGWLAVRPTG